MKMEDMAKLKEPFPESDLDWRLQSCGEKNGKFWGKALAYITSRAVQDRLDEVCGPDGWKTSVRREGDAYICTLSVRVTHEDGATEWLSREDGADSTDIEAIKGGISGAIKRSAVHFGIGRYLYNLKDGWAVICENGKYSGKTKEGKWFNWNPPALPSWALPGGSGKSDATSINVSKKKEPTPPSEDAVKKCEELKSKLMDFEDVIPDDSWKDIDNAVKAGSVAFLQKMLSWATEESKKAS